MSLTPTSMPKMPNSTQRSKTKWLLGSLTLMAVTSASVAGVIYRQTLDFPLYQHEQYKGGTKAAELEAFVADAAKVAWAQKTLASRATDHQNRRVFHAKSHGCLTGKLNLLNDRMGDARRETYEGLFSASGPQSYNVLVRYSNGVGNVQADSKADVRGMAIKVFGARSAESRASQTVDLLMTNSTNPFGRDQSEFIEFMVANVDPGLLDRNLLAYLATHLRAARYVVRATSRTVHSLTTERYWSGHPYLLGPNLAMKFNVSPLSEGDTLVPRSHPDYLKEDLRARAAAGEIRYTLSVQLEKDETTTPIEDQLVEWQESDSPSIPVAELVLDRQAMSDQQDAICDELSFTPGHYLPENRPLGNMGRGRLFTYEASALGRAAVADPDESVVETLRQKNRLAE